MREHRLLLIATALAVSAASVCTLAQDNARDLLEAAGFTRVSVEEPGASQEGFLVVMRKQ